MRRRACAFIIWAACAGQAAPQTAAGSYRLVRSLSGPSGTVVDSKFVLDETRNRFAFPQDKSFVVYFEWEGPPGDHSITGRWKGPDARVISISSDIKVHAPGRQIAAYWTYNLSSGLPNGVWTLETSIDGEPAGSHSFEVVIPAEANPPAPAGTAPPAAQTPDDIYRQTKQSLVWIHKLDANGRRVETASGFVYATDKVATSFQSIDSADSIEVEFEDGRRAPAEKFIASSRFQDWAVAEVPTQQIAPLRKGDPARLAIAERLLVYNVDMGLVRAFGGVDLSARRTVPEFGERLQLTPSPTLEATGGPLLNANGEVVAIIGGGTLPGMRFNRRALTVSASLYQLMNQSNAATPIHLVRAEGIQRIAYADMRKSGQISPMIEETPALLYGSTSRQFKSAQNLQMPATVSEFSRKETQIWVYTVWQRAGKIGKGNVSAVVYDAANQMRVNVLPKKLTIPSAQPIRHGFSFAPQALPAGTYRVDVHFDSRPVWRTAFTIVD